MSYICSKCKFITVEYNTPVYNLFYSLADSQLRFPETELAN